jgi:hypothetical protein
VNEGVEIHVTVKNVRRINIKIYEVNLKKYYLESETPLQDDVDLSFLIPTHRQAFENPINNPFQLTTNLIKLDKIPNRMGLFIVDLEG